MQNQNPQTPTQQPQVDMQALNLAKSIRQAESGGNFNAAGDYVNGVPTSKGAFQWQAATWKAQAGQILGDPNAVMSPANQNAVAYGIIKSWKDQGLNPAQIAAKWNSGHEVGWENMVGTNPDTKISYNVPAYVNKVMGYYQQFKSQTPDNSLIPTAQASDGSTPAPTTQGPSVGGFIENAAGSAANLVGGLANAALHPIDTVSNVLGSAAGGVEKLFGANNADTQKFDNVVSYFKNRYGGDSLSEIAGNIGHTLYTDPVGAALDVSTLLDGVGAAVGAVGKVADVSRAADIAKATDMIKGAQDLLAGNVTQDSANTARTLGEAATPGIATQVGTGIKTAAEYSNPITPVVSATKSILGLTGKLVGTTAEQITGIPAETLADNFLHGEDYTAAARANLDRGGLAQEFGDAVDSIFQNKSDVGAEYGPIRESGITVSVPAEVIKQAFADSGLTITQTLDKEGNPAWDIAKPTASTRLSAGDVSHFKQLLDQYGASHLTADQFLNAREKFSEYANYDGKTTAASKLAKDLRGAYEKLGDEQIPALKKLDEEFAPIKNQTKTLKQFLTKDPETGQMVLKDNTASKLAKAINKPQLIKTLEKISPGITHKIEVLKNIEAVEDAMKIKVGTYTKSILTGGAVATGNIPLVVGMIIAHPAVITKILRGFGYVSKVTVMPILAKVRALIGALPPGAIMSATKVGVEANKTQS